MLNLRFIDSSAVTAVLKACGLARKIMFRVFIDSLFFVAEYACGELSRHHQWNTLSVQFELARKLYSVRSRPIVVKDGRFVDQFGLPLSKKGQRVSFPKWPGKASNLL